MHRCATPCSPSRMPSRRATMTIGAKTSVATSTVRTARTVRITEKWSWPAREVNALAASLETHTASPSRRARSRVSGMPNACGTRRASGGASAATRPAARTPRRSLRRSRLRSPSTHGSEPRSSTTRTSLAAARWPASATSRRTRRSRRGHPVPRASALRRCAAAARRTVPGRCREAVAPRSSASSAAPGPPSVPVTYSASPARAPTRSSGRAARAEHRDRERQLARARDVAADDRDTSRAAATSPTPCASASSSLRHAGGTPSASSSPSGRGGHRRQVAERGGGGARADLARRQPSAPEVHVLERRVRARDERLALGQRQHRGVVADPVACVPPHAQHRADGVELHAGAEREMRPRRRDRHRGDSPTAGSSASTGGRGAPAPVAHTAGSACSTSSSVYPRTWPRAHRGGGAPVGERGERPGERRVVRSARGASTAMPPSTSPAPPVASDGRALRPRRASCPSGDATTVGTPLSSTAAPVSPARRAGDVEARCEHGVHVETPPAARTPPDAASAARDGRRSSAAQRRRRRPRTR